MGSGGGAAAGAPGGVGFKGPVKLTAHDFTTTDYVHAPHMYRPWQMKHRKLKWGTAIVALVVAGSAIPPFAAWFQIKKSMG
eukprot:jgi/Botrbrau1/17355/Bobra.0015s0098.1